MSTIAVEGLSAPSEIRIDRWGLPHISAQSVEDLFFSQGFNAARDRLWQIDLWRKRGLGLLAEDFGPGYLLQDEASRLFLYRGDMAAEWASYGEDAERICRAFAAGVNARVGLVHAGEQPLPEEFGRLGTGPSFWRAEDVVRIRTHCLTRNAASEVLRANVLALAGPETDLLREKLQPPVPAEEWTRGAAHLLPPEALRLYELATAPVFFSRERLAARLEDAGLWDMAALRGEAPPAAGPMEGSNNWAIASARTATGRPIMASDPHRLHAAPSLRYLAHLKAPGIDVIGAGEPSSPGIMAGHNGHSAFSLTIFCADQEDVLVYESDPKNPDRYRYGDGWEDMETVEEIFGVKGAPDQVRVQKHTRHGPVFYQDGERGIAAALRTVFSEPGSAPYMACLSAMRATSFEEFGAAMAGWGAPSVNQVYADVTGRIGWLAAGRMPRRDGWRGLTPVSGDGGREWRGFLSPEEKPQIVDPACGFVQSANEMNLPADWPHEEVPVGFEWHEDGRAERISAVLSARTDHTLADSCALQTDTFSLVAQRLVALLPETAEDPEAQAAVALLRGWDFFIEADCAPALLYEFWWNAHLVPAVLERAAPDPALRALLLPGEMPAIVDVMERGEALFGLGSKRERTALLTKTLAAAWAALRKEFGEDAGLWRWGDLHKGFFAHALTPLAAGDGPTLDVGPLAKGGSASTAMFAQYDPASYRVTHGASVRMVVDVGAWDNSVCVNAPGQSGDPASPHYADLAGPWSRGEYVPLLYSEEAVAAATETVIRLVPKQAGDV